MTKNFASENNSTLIGIHLVFFKVWMFSSAIVDLGVFIGAGAEAGAFWIISGVGSRLVSWLSSGSV